MKNRILSLVVLSTLLFSSAAFAQRQERSENDREMPEARKAMLMKKRQAMRDNGREKFFTEEQREAMKEINLKTAKEVKPLRNELRELTAHQQTLTTADKADMNAINNNIDKMSSVKAEIAKIQAKKHQEIRSLLTEEQLLKFDAMKQHRNKGERQKFPDQRTKRGDRHPYGERS